MTEHYSQNNRPSKQSFLAKRLNMLVALGIILGILIGGYFLVKSALKEDEAAPTTTEKEITLCRARSRAPMAKVR